MKKNKELTKENIEKSEENQNENIHPYDKGGIFARIPFIVKAIFMKWWAYGVGIFFIFWGTSNLITGGETAPNPAQVFVLLCILALFNGVVSDCVVFHFIYLMDDDTNKTKNVVFFHNKKFYSVIINVVYSAVVTLVAYNLFNLCALLLYINFDLEISVEPIFTGILFLLVDLLFILIKNLIVKLIGKIKGGHKNV